MQMRILPAWKIPLELHLAPADAVLRPRLRGLPSLARFLHPAQTVLPLPASFPSSAEPAHTFSLRGIHFVPPPGKLAFFCSGWKPAPPEGTAVQSLLLPAVSVRTVPEQQSVLSVPLFPLLSVPCRKKAKPSQSAPCDSAHPRSYHASGGKSPPDGKNEAPSSSDAH